MASPFVGEIKMFAGNFAPQHYAFCEGQLLAVSQNETLFSLLGTRYGGDGTTTFAVPDFRGRIPVHMGQGPGLTNRTIGQKGGTETTALSASNLPGHSHIVQGTTSVGDSNDPQGKIVAATVEKREIYSTDMTSLTELNDATVGGAGGDIAHENRMSYLCINFLIALDGEYPSRN